VILDEPFSGLDPINAQILKDAVRRQVKLGKTVVFSSHQMAQVEEFCDDISIIDNGRCVLEGNLSEIKRSYPRDRIMVETDVGAELSEILGTLPFVKALEPMERGITVTLGDPKARMELLHTIDSKGLTIEKFAVAEPTLEQIFIEKAGEPE